MSLQFSFRLPPDQEEVIKKRAEALYMDGATPFVRAIVDWWFKVGCPPVAPAEQPGYVPNTLNSPSEAKGKKGRTEGPAIGTHDRENVSHRSRHG
jgi:hypothetical protein